MTENDANAAFEAAGFSASNTTKKVVEYVSQTGRVVYLRLGQGFPQHADVVVDPKVASSSLLSIADVTVNPRVEFRFGSNMEAFPKKKTKAQNRSTTAETANIFKSSSLELCRQFAALP